MTDNPQIPANWYPDPTGPTGQLRYWDGQAWTQHVHQTQAQQASQQSTPAGDAAQSAPAEQQATSTSGTPAAASQSSSSPAGGDAPQPIGSTTERIDLAANPSAQTAAPAQQSWQPAAQPSPQAHAPGQESGQAQWGATPWGAAPQSAQQAPQQQVPQQQAPQWGAQAPQQYAPATSAARTAATPLASLSSILLIVLAVVAAARVAIEIKGILVVNSLSSGKYGEDGRLYNNLHQIGQILLIVAIAVLAWAFIRWEIAVSRKDPSGAERASLDDRVTIVEWFAPGANLVMPALTMRDRLGGLLGAAPGTTSIPGAIKGWWICWATGLVMFVLSIAMTQTNYGKLDTLRIAMIVDVIAMVLIAVSSVLAMLMVKKIGGGRE